MPTVNLAPLTLGELLDQTFSYLRKHFWLFAGIMAAPQTLLVGLNLLTQVFLRPPRFVPGTRVVPSAQMVAFMARAGASTLAILLAYYVVYALALGATTYALSEIHLGRATTILESYRAVRRRLGRLINVTLTILVRTFGVFVLAGFFLAFCMVLMAPCRGRSCGSPSSWDWLSWWDSSLPESC